MKKKHQPGCPCCTSPNPCGCDISQLRVNITSNNLISLVCDAYLVGDPCDPTEFTFDLEGTHYIPATMDLNFVELFYHNLEGMIACAMNPLPDTKRCILVRIVIGTSNCNISIMVQVYEIINSTGIDASCPTWEQVGEIFAGNPSWAGWSAHFIDPLSSGPINLGNWCESYDQTVIHNPLGYDPCWGTPLEVNLEIYPST